MHMRQEEEESGKDDEESDKREENREKLREERRTLMRSRVPVGPVRLRFAVNIHMEVSRGQD